MNIKELNNRQCISTHNKLSRIYSQFGELLNELSKKELNQNVEKCLNESVDNLNSSTLNEIELTKLVKQKQTAILKQVENEHKIVPKSYYRTTRTLIGMRGFGVPIVVAFGLGIGNIGLLGLGLTISMLLDKKALNEGRLLNIEIKN